MMNMNTNMAKQMRIRLSRSRLGRLGKIGCFGLTAAIVGAGCGGPQKPKIEVVESEGGGTASADDPIAALAKQAPPTRAVSEDERADFSKAIARYLELSKKGRLDAGACDKAADAFASAVRDNPKLTEARYNQGRVLLGCGREDDAIQIFQDLVKGPNPYAPALTNLGLLAWRKKDLAGAEKMFIRAIEIDANINSAAARNNLAQILRDRMMTAGGEERKRLAGQAIRHLRTVLAVDGNNLQAYATLCHVYHELDLDDMARLVGDQAISRANEIATGHFVEEREMSAAEVQAGGGGKKVQKGKGGKDVKSDDKGKKALTEVQGTGYTVEMNQQLALVYNTLGLVDLHKKSVTAAIANFGRAIEKDPDLFEARMNRAALSLNFRNYTTSEEDFRAVLKAQPRNFEAVIGLGVALRGGKKVDEAEKQYLAAVQLDAANPKSYYNLGLLYQDYKGSQKPELQKAQQYYRDFIGKAGGGAGDPMKKEAQKRIKDIDEMFVALVEAEKMQREAEEMQRKADEQQKVMQEELKKQLLLEQQQQAAAAQQPAAPEAAPAPATKAPPAPAAPQTQPPAARP